MTISLRAYSALIAQLEQRDVLSLEEKLALNALFEEPRLCKAGEFIVHNGAKPRHSVLLLSGFAARQILMGNGGRSLTQLCIAGDFIDLHSLLMEQMDHDVVAMTDCIVANASHARIIETTLARPHLGRLFWLDTLIDGAIQRQWLHRLGRQTATGRMAHLICEMEVRLTTVSLAADGQFDLPLSQSELADILGLSTVHTNRVLMELRGSDLIEWRGSHIRILDRQRLYEVAEFDPTYLRLQKAPV